MPAISVLLPVTLKDAKVPSSLPTRRIIRIIDKGSAGCSVRVLLDTSGGVRTIRTLDTAKDLADFSKSFIEVTLLNGKKEYFNPDFIEEIQPHSTGSQVNLLGDEVLFGVRCLETPAELAKLIKQITADHSDLLYVGDVDFNFINAFGSGQTAYKTFEDAKPLGFYARRSFIKVTEAFVSASENIFYQGCMYGELHEAGADTMMNAIRELSVENFNTVLTGATGRELQDCNFLFNFGGENNPQDFTAGSAQLFIHISTYPDTDLLVP